MSNTHSIFRARSNFDSEISQYLLGFHRRFTIWLLKFTQTILTCDEFGLDIPSRPLILFLNHPRSFEVNLAGLGQTSGCGGCCALDLRLRFRGEARLYARLPPLAHRLDIH
jgi:hypothetical protein